MPEHPEFTIWMAPLSTQEIQIKNNDGDIVRLVTDNFQDRTMLAGAIHTGLVLFEVLKKKGN